MISDVVVNIKRRLFSKKISECLEKISHSPFNPKHHYDLGFIFLKSGDKKSAYAQLKTASCLGHNKIPNQTLLGLRLTKQDLIKIEHNQFLRLKRIAKKAIKFFKDESSFSVLDVGGGSGLLAHFLPHEIEYCLFEPSLNGLSTQLLPINTKNFTVVIASHVLEHIPDENKEVFMDKLVLQAKDAIIMLNPFEDSPIKDIERLTLIWEITKSRWAQEHIQCKLPTLQWLKDYAKKNKLQLTLTPHGSRELSVAMVFVEYFSKRSFRFKDLHKITKFYNSLDEESILSDRSPNAYISVLQKDNLFTTD